MSSSRPIITLSLNAFIRLYSLDPVRLVGEVNRRMQQPGGYDFYKILSDAIRAKIRGAGEDEIDYILNRASRPSEVSYNRAAYEMFVEKFGSKRSLGEFEHKGQVRLAGGDLVVKVSPIFTIVSSDVMSVFHVWAAQQPKMDRSRASVGCYLMAEAFKKTAPNYSYKVFDSVEGKSFSGVSNATALAVASVAKNIVEYAKM